MVINIYDEIFFKDTFLVISLFGVSYMKKVNKSLFVVTLNPAVCDYCTIYQPRCQLMNDNTYYVV